MDIYCPKCGEPWDMDSLHDMVEDGLASSYQDARKKFSVNGCKALGTSHGSADVEVRGLRASDASAALFDVLGDDVDGIAAMMEDYGF